MKKVLFLSVIVFSLAACSKEEVKKSNAACNTLATVRDLRGLDGCGFVFELADGKRLEPQITLLLRNSTVAKRSNRKSAF
jgi:hypothetical protein